MLLKRQDWLPSNGRRREKSARQERPSRRQLLKKPLACKPSKMRLPELLQKRQLKRLVLQLNWLQQKQLLPPKQLELKRRDSLKKPVLQQRNGKPSVRKGKPERRLRKPRVSKLRQPLQRQLR